MLTQEEREHFASFTRLMQILVIAMIVGIVTFGIVTLFLPTPLNKASEEDAAFPVITAIAIAYGLASFVLAPFIASFVTGIIRKAIASGKTLSSVRINAPSISREFLTTPLGVFCKAYMSRTIVFVAVIESSALFCIVAYMLEANLLCLACAALAVLYLLMIFPNMDRMERWIEMQRRMVKTGGESHQLR